jgi:hypothetical protein
MSLTTYSDLPQALIDWPDLQGEVDLDNYADTLITLGESRINVALRLRRNITSLLVDNGKDEVTSYALPDDFLEVDRVLGPDGVPLLYRSQDQVSTLQNTEGVQYDACTYSIDGNFLIFSEPITTFELSYYAKLQPLESTDTNWLYALAPGLYLYSALIEAAVFSKESEQETARYSAQFERIASQVLALDDASNYPRSQPLKSVRKL